MTLAHVGAPPARHALTALQKAGFELLIALLIAVLTNAVVAIELSLSPTPGVGACGSPVKTGLFSGAKQDAPAAHTPAVNASQNGDAKLGAVRDAISVHGSIASRQLPLFSSSGVANRVTPYSAVVARALNPNAPVLLMIPGVVLMQVATALQSADGSEARHDTTAAQNAGFVSLIALAMVLQTNALLATPLLQTPVPAVQAVLVQSSVAPTSARSFACPPFIVGPSSVGFVRSGLTSCTPFRTAGEHPQGV